jgi:hypothetical protein
MSDYHKHNYVKDLLQNPPGTVQHVQILPNDWCAVFKKGCCNRNPEIKTVRPTPRQKRGPGDAKN